MTWQVGASTPECRVRCPVTTCGYCFLTAGPACSANNFLPSSFDSLSKVHTLYGQLYCGSPLKVHEASVRVRQLKQTKHKKHYMPIHKHNTSNFDNQKLNISFLLSYFLVSLQATVMQPWLTRTLSRPCLCVILDRGQPVSKAMPDLVWCMSGIWSHERPVRRGQSNKERSMFPFVHFIVCLNSIGILLKGL